MTDRKSFKLSHDKARALALEAVRTAEQGWEVTISPPKRSLDQGALFHAICADVAKSGKEWAGSKRTQDQWKAIFVSGHSQATGSGGEVIPGIEGEFIAIRESTARMGKARASSLIDYTLAWCAANGIEITDRRDYGW